MFKKIFSLTLLVILIIILSACQGVFTGKPNDKNDDSPDSAIIEGDIVKTYGNYIIIYNSKKINIVHTNQGMMTKVASKTSDNSSSDANDILIYNHYMITIEIKQIEIIVENLPKSYKDISTVTIYDLSTLSPTGYNFPIVESLVFDGKCKSSKVQDGILYLVSTYKGEVKTSDDIIESSYKQNNNAVSISSYIYIDSCEEDKENYSILTATSLIDNTFTTDSVVMYGNLSEICLYPDALFAVFSNGSTSSIANLSLNFELVGIISDEDYNVINRYAINYDGDYLMIVTNHSTLGARLSIYNNSLELEGRISNLAPGERVMSVRYNTSYCYIVTYLVVDPVFKIDTSDKTNPILTSELKITGFSTYLHLINEMDLGIGVGLEENSRSKITLFNVANDVTEIKSIVSPYIIFTLATVDPRAILVDRDRNLIIIIGLGDLSSESNKLRYFNVVIYKYSSDNLTIEKLISKDMNNSLMSLIYGRCVIIGDFLYVVDEFEIRSFSLNDNYSSVNSILYHN